MFKLKIYFFKITSVKSHWKQTKNLIFSMQIFIFRSIFFTLWSLDVDPNSVWSLMRIQDPNYNVC